jgi:hypothetical protein
MTPACANCTPKLTSRFNAREQATLGERAARKGLTVEQYVRTCMGYAYPDAAPLNRP